MGGHGNAGGCGCIGRSKGSITFKHCCGNVFIVV